jgi:predicted dehydrogenase
MAVPSTELRTGVTRREFVSTTGAATVGALAASSDLLGAQAATKKRYAIVGTGVRGIGMWGRPIAERFGDVVEFVGLCDINPLRVEVAKRRIGVSCPTFTNLDEMIAKVKPTHLMVTTVDAFHADCIVRALTAGVNVITEKPMTIDEKQCQAVLDAERAVAKPIVVTFNYRYAPKHQKIKEILMSGEIGAVTGVDFSWYLDTTHGADYFRRWHRLRERSGSLWVHKATHHFDLINWWLAADPVEVTAYGRLAFYGKNGPFRSTHCRSCAHTNECEYFWDLRNDKQLYELYAECESADGYHRDGCVFKEDINIFDTMNAIVRYSSGVQMSYSVNTFMPIEGYRVAFNGTKGRLEVRDYERQAWDPGEETEMHIIRNFGQRVKVDIPKASGGHGGGDDVLRNLVFRNIEVVEHMRLPNSRAGAMSCLTGIAARHSIDERRPVKISELIRLT